VTAVIFSSDVFAAGVVLSAKKLGIRVPDDLAIAGFGDFEISAMLEPAAGGILFGSRRLVSGRARLHADAGRLTLVQPDSLEARVAALETQVRELGERVRASEQDAAAARVLAGAADRDVTEFRGELRDFRLATVTSFNALREDLTGLRNHVDNGFAAVDERFTEMRGKLDAASAGQQQIVDLLERLIADQG
jgi:hypothetical protein